MRLSRLSLLFASLILCASSLAATMAERSPFRQGHWWTPSASGSGFDFFSSGTEAMAIWYTYDRSGKPVWYTAQGPVSTLGQPWTLLRHRWANGRKAEPVSVGTLSMKVLHPESIEAAFVVEGAAAKLTIEPFVNSGTTNEVDHTGSWYVPGNDGWGLAVTQQGEVLGGVLFTYDPAGEPMWVAGFGRERDSVEMHYFTGTCPTCAYARPIGRSVGRLDFEFANELQLTLRNRSSVAMAAGIGLDGARMTQIGRPASARAADRQLAAFDDATALRDYLRVGMTTMRPYSGGSNFSAAPPGSTPQPFSTTNLVENGVDEADLVKTDGTHIYTFQHNEFGTRLPMVRVARVLQDGELIEQRSSVGIATSNVPGSLGSAGLFLHGDHLVSVTGTQAYNAYISPWIAGGAWEGGRTSVQLFDVTQRDSPTSRWRAELDGHVVASRRIGDRIYLVLRHVPSIPGVYVGYSSPASLAILQGTPLEALLPKVRIDGGQPTSLVAPSQVYAPPMGGRPPMADMITVVAVDLRAPGISQAFAVVGGAESVYVSERNMYLATSRYELRDRNGFFLTTTPPALITDIHQVRLDANDMRLVASGTVEGFLAQDPALALFRMSEHQGRLRVVTSSNAWWGQEARNRLTILEPSTQAPGVLKTVSYLPNARRPQSLGKPGESLHGTRFAGDRLYAVTFRKIDPLYVVDVADPADPRIAGELELPGFSDYLHPLPNGLLLGFGKDTVPAAGPGDGQFAWYQGLALTLFDVSDTAAPRELQRVIIGRRGSDSALLRDHHAFSALRRADGTLAIAFPARVHEGSPSYSWGDSGSTFYNWSYSGLARIDLTGHTPATARLIQRSFVVSHRMQPGESSSLYSGYDPATSTGRSILFENNSLYIGNGRFWDHDRAGNIYGPY